MSWTKDQERFNKRQEKAYKGMNPLNALGIFALPFLFFLPTNKSKSSRESNKISHNGINTPQFNLTEYTKSEEYKDYILYHDSSYAKTLFKYVNDRKNKEMPNIFLVWAIIIFIWVFFIINVGFVGILLACIGTGCVIYLFYFKQEKHKFGDYIYDDEGWLDYRKMLGPEDEIIEFKQSLNIHEIYKYYNNNIIIVHEELYYREINKYNIQGYKKSAVANRHLLFVFTKEMKIEYFFKTEEELYKLLSILLFIKPDLKEYTY